MNENLLKVQNARILENIKEEVKKCSTDIKFRDDKLNIEEYKQEFVKNVNRIYHGSKIITENINKTGIPDEAVLILLRQQSCFVNSIEVFDNVELDINEKNDNIINIGINVRYTEFQKRTVIEIKHNYQEENNEN